MNIQAWDKLVVGDQVVNIATGRKYVIVKKLFSEYIVSETLTISIPSEWNVATNKPSIPQRLRSGGCILELLKEFDGMLTYSCISCSFTMELTFPILQGILKKGTITEG